MEDEENQDILYYENLLIKQNIIIILNQKQKLNGEVLNIRKTQKNKYINKKENGEWVLQTFHNQFLNIYDVTNQKQIDKIEKQITELQAELLSITSTTK